MTGTVKAYIKSCNELFKGNKANESLYYHGIYDFLLREGRQFKSEKLNISEKNAVMKLFKDFKRSHGVPKYKQCFYNAQIALFNDPNRLFHYSEGYAIDPKIGIPLHHGFLTINNKVVDIT